MRKNKKINNARYLAALLAMLLLVNAPNASFASTTEHELVKNANVPKYASFFNENDVCDIFITMSDYDYKSMKENPSVDDYYHANITLGDTTLNDVGFRLKGSSTFEELNHIGEDKFSIKIKFNKYVNKQKFNKLDEINFNNMFYDPSFMREHLHYSIIDELDLPAPYTRFANVYINGNYHGFFLAVEAIDNSFLKNEFNDKDLSNNVLYKTRYSLFKKGINKAQNDEETILNSFELKKGKDENNEKIKLLLKQMKELDANDSSTQENLENILNVDTFLMYIATNTVLGNYDSFNGSNMHNFYLFEDDNGRFNVIPWDMNMTLKVCNSQMLLEEVDVFHPYLTDEFDEINRFTQGTIDLLLSVPKYREKYISYINQTINALSNINEKIDKIDSLIRPYVINEPNHYISQKQYDASISSTYTPLNDETIMIDNDSHTHKTLFIAKNVSIKQYLENRIKYIRYQLDNMQTKKLNIYIDGNILNLTSPIVIKNDTTYVNIYDFLVKEGYTFTNLQRDISLYYSRGNDELIQLLFTPNGMADISINKKKLPEKIETFTTEKDEVYVPIRKLAEIFGYTISWQEQDNSIRVNKNK